MALSITVDGTQTVTDATGSSGVACLSGVADGATVRLAITASSGVTIPLAGAKMNEPIVVTHGTGATLVAKAVGCGASTVLTLDFYPL
ncbi:MAG: hypothetical protein DRI65_12850 [Chloroflexota bacterium]|nr:MAG: hypothetical protein DRI65_12850 [Chloroflexota bacterium]